MYRGPATALLVSLALTIPAAASAESPGGHAGADGQASAQQAAPGPDRAGLAWSHELEVGGDPVAFDDGGSIEDDFILSSNDLFILHGTVSSDLPGTPEDESSDSRGVLIAVDPSDGSSAWTAPTVDVDPSCSPVATSDDRILAHLEADSPTNPDSAEDLVAIDATTGQLVAGQSYESPGVDQDLEPSSSTCRDRLLLASDESMVFVQEGDFIRAVDISSTPWTQAWFHSIRNLDDVKVSGSSQLVMSPDGTRLYYTVRADNSPLVELLRAIRTTDGTLIDEVELPGHPQANSGFAAIGGGVVLYATDCVNPAQNSADCLIRIDDDGASLSVGMEYDLRFGETPTLQTGPSSINSISVIDGERVVATGEAGVWGFNHSGQGAFEWRVDGRGEQRTGVVTDPDGNGYFPHSGGWLKSVDADGRTRWEIPLCHVDGADVDRFGPIAADGTLLSMQTLTGPLRVVISGVRAGAGLPKGTCPEEDTRVAGVGRVETSVEISETSFPQPESADTVVIATASNYPDALAGGPLARKLDAPLLLTLPSALSGATAAEIQRLGAGHAVLLGGTGALAAQVEADIKALGLTTERLAGKNRFETAGLIAERVPSTTVYVTEGANANPNRGWPDAVAVSGLASFELRPIILATQTSLPQPSRDVMVKLGVTDAVVVGGPAAVSSATAAAVADPDGDGTEQVTVTRESGTSRYGTSVALARRSVAAGASTFDLWFATGLDFPDALAAGPAVARSGGVLLLVNGRNPDGGLEVYEWLQTLEEDDTLRAWLVGGVGAVTDDVATKLAAAARIEG